MDMSAIADWLTILFFLWYGLKTFVPAFQKGFLRSLGGIIAFAAVLVLFLDRSP